MAISKNTRYTFLALNTLFLASGLIAFSVGLYFNTTTEARRNAVVSSSNLYSLIMGGIIILATSVIGFVGYMEPIKRKQWLLAFCWLVVGLMFTCIGLGCGVWFQTLTMHDDSGLKWRSSWSYNLRRAFQEAKTDAPCCGFMSPRDAPALTDVCFDQSALPGCQDFVFSYADSYLRNIYTFIFSLTFLDLFVFLAGVIFVQERNDEARFERMAAKMFGGKGEVRMRELGADQGMSSIAAKASYDLPRI